MSAVTAQTPFDELPTLLTIKEVAIFTRRSLPTVFRWLRRHGRTRKTLKATRVGKRRMIRKTDLDAFLK